MSGLKIWKPSPPQSLVPSFPVFPSFFSGLRPLSRATQRKAEWAFASSSPLFALGGGGGQDHQQKPWSLNWSGRSSMSEPITWELFNNSQTCSLSLEGHVVVGVAPISICISIGSVYGDGGRGCTYQWFIGHFVQLSNIGKANFHRLDVLMSWWFV